MTALAQGDRVRIQAPKEHQPVRPGTITAAFERQPGYVLCVEAEGYYRIQLDRAVHVDGVGAVTNDIWQRGWLRKLR